MNRVLYSSSVVSAVNPVHVCCNISQQSIVRFRADLSGIAETWTVYHSVNTTFVTYYLFDSRVCESSLPSLAQRSEHHLEILRKLMRYVYLMNNNHRIWIMFYASNQNVSLLRTLYMQFVLTISWSFQLIIYYIPIMSNLLKQTHKTIASKIS